MNEEDIFWNDKETSEFVELFAHLKPNYTCESYKGENGRICIIGGSKLYHGAPCLAADAALIAGGELVYIITTPEASLPIKNYSPDFIVCPLLVGQETTHTFDYANTNQQTFNDIIHPEVINIINKTHAILIGPGLGEDVYIQRHVCTLLHYCVYVQKPLVIDADGLRLLAKNVQILKILLKTKFCLFTPNFREYQILTNTLTHIYKDKYEEEEKNTQQDIEICNLMENCFFLQKSNFDKFFCKNFKFCSKFTKITKRPGGIGDILAGVCTTHIAWANKKYKKQTNVEIFNKKFENLLPTHNSMVFVGTVVSSMVVKGATQRCFLNKKQAMKASDILKTLGTYISEKLYS